MIVKKFSKGCVATFVALSVILPMNQALAAPQEVAKNSEVLLDASAAVVNTDIILQSELNRAQQQVMENFKRRGNTIDPTQARRAALEGLITRSISLQMAKKSGINLTDTQIDQAIASAAASTNMSVKDFLKTSGAKDEATARQYVAEEMMVNEIRRSQVRQRVKISDAEVALLAKTLKNIGSVEPSYHLGLIVLPLSADATYQQVQAVTAQANSIKRRAQQGEDFNALAAEFAQGSMAFEGGDLGYIPEAQVPVPFLPALLKAKNGDIVGPFRSPFGLHILKLYDVTNQAVEPITTYKAKHILLTTSVIFSDQAAQTELSNLKKQITSGKISFADAAKKYSEDTGSAPLGGELGYAPANRYDPGFAQGLIKLQPGQISDPIKSSFGWHLIYLEDKKIDKNSDEAYKQRAYDLIYKRLFEQESIAWEKELRESAFVRITDPVLISAGLDKSMDSKKNISAQ